MLILVAFVTPHGQWKLRESICGRRWHVRGLGDVNATALVQAHLDGVDWERMTRQEEVGLGRVDSRARTRRPAREKAPSMGKDWKDEDGLRAAPCAHRQGVTQQPQQKWGREEGKRGECGAIKGVGRRRTAGNGQEGRTVS